MIATAIPAEPIIIQQAPHDPNRLMIVAPFALKDVVKGIPGARARFNDAKKFEYWHVPATPSTVGIIRDTFKGLKVRADQCFKALLAQANSSDEANELKLAEELPPIPYAKSTPWLHQLRAFWYCMNQQATGLFLEMGAGKSAVVVWLVSQLPMFAKVLILCPKSVVTVWPKQFNIHTERVISVAALGKGSVAGKVAEAKKILDHATMYNTPFVAVVNYESAWRDPFAEWALAQDWDLVVLDESHKIKAPGGKASEFCARLGSRANRRLILTGTPMPHSPLDVYAQYRFLDPGLFGTNFAKFRANYAIMGGFEGRQVVAYKNLDQLQGQMYRIAYRVRTQDVLDLPKAVHITRYAELSAPARKIYKKLEDDFIAFLEGAGPNEFEAAELENLDPYQPDKPVVLANHVLTRLLRLAQVANGFAKDDQGNIHQVDTSKADLLEDELDNLPETEPVIIFCRFQQDLDTVHRIAQKLNRQSAELSGRVNQLEIWQRGGADDPTVLAVQIQAGGAGIDLTRAAYVFYYATGFSYGDYEQSLARAVRPGQTRSVRIVHLLTEGTVDEYIQQVLEKRADLVNGVTNISPDMVKDMVAAYKKGGK